jgi:hypothetical protein
MVRRQLNLFEYHPKQPCLAAACNKAKAQDQNAPAYASDLISLLSNLEESKFLRFFRHIEYPEDPDPEDPDSSSDAVTTLPLDFQGAEVHLMEVKDNLAGFGACYFNQVVHLPTSLWRSETIEEYCEDQLWRALANFKRRPDLTKKLDGTSTYEFYHGGGGPPQPDILPEDYFFFTNICHEILKHGPQCPNGFESTARNLFTRVLSIPLERCPSIHITTPETILGGPAKSEVVRFLIDVANSPSSYYLLAREGRISVIPAVEHGLFFATGSEPAAFSGSGVTTIPASAIAPSRLITSNLIFDFEHLLNARNIKEREIQEFIEVHPQLLSSLDERYCEIRPHVCLYDATGERLVPDFMARIQDSNLWDVIELKLPKDVLTVNCHTAQKASAAAARGISELLRHRDYFSVRDNRRRVLDRLGTAPYEPGLVLIIGRGYSASKFEWKSVRAGFPHVQIVSYDYVFEHARRRACGLSNMAVHESIC